MSITIRKVQREDLSQVSEIAQSLSLSRLTVAQAEKSGFLVSEFSLEIYEQYLQSKQYFFVAESNKKIVGFLLAYESTDIAPDETLNTLLKTNLQTSFVLIKQICVAKDQKGLGIASRLYQYLFETASTPRFAAAIVMEPFNEASISFHERKGFNKLCDIVPPADADGTVRSRGVWFRDLQKNTLPVQRWIPVDSTHDQSLLMEKQHAAIQLYNHEDNLNWTKFGMLITFMMALIAAADYLLKQQASITYQVLVFIVVIMGYAINFMFYQKIKSGLKFMNHHKRSVSELDQELIGLNPRLRKLIKNGDQQIRGKSITSRWMDWAPKISMGLWTLCSTLLIFTHFFTTID